MPKTCIVIVGPTAVGKTACAINLAKTLDTKIISADSRQCYRELNIGVAKPSKQALQSVHHYFIDSHSIHDEINAAIFEKYALAAVDEIFGEHDTAIMVGGTGLYINAFCSGLDEIPVIVPGIRERLIKSYHKYGLGWLQELVKKNDPDYFKHEEKFNPQRLMRALEVKLSTGRSIKTFHTHQKINRPFSIIKVGIELPKAELYLRIDQRVDEMINSGLEEEVRQLIDHQQLNSLNTVGYKELFSFIDGKYTLGGAIELIKTNTRHYAKRQLTWFKKDAGTRWIVPGECNQILKLTGL